MQLRKMMDDARIEAGYPELVTDWDKYIRAYTTMEDKFLKEHDHGFIAGMYTNGFMLMDNVRICLEVAWYVEPEHRKTGVGMDLYHSLEEWARKMGCEYIVQGRPTKGCTKVGSHYMRKLD